MHPERGRNPPESAASHRDEGIREVAEEEDVLPAEEIHRILDEMIYGKPTR